MTESLKGQSIIAGEYVAGDGRVVTGFNPATNETLDPEYSMIDEAQLKLATDAAAEAYRTFSVLDPDSHSAFLEKIAENIDTLGDPLTQRMMLETGLSEVRATGERNRVVKQLKLFADVVRQGDFRGVRWDPAMQERRPDVRQRKISVGPVAVFGASNFPLAFSVAGGDTASALAAGCPVVFKAHNAHPGTSELVGTAITKAVKDSGLHPGVFSIIYGPGASIGQALVSDPAIKAVGFTGSRSAGLSLMRAGAAREVPIPVYAEMSSINPVFVFEGGLSADTTGNAELASDYLTSVTGSSGQLCTQPGLVFVPTGDKGDAFVSAVSNAVSSLKGQTMLTASICHSWIEGAQQLANQPGVELIGKGYEGQAKNSPAPIIYQTSADRFRENLVLHEEIFGAASLIVRYDSVADLSAAASQMEGQLTASLHLTSSDYEAAAELIPVLEQRAGRILANGWPTGVEVNHAMVHGGPFPATSDSRTTSVGTLAIERFLRPVAYQNIPESLLPTPVQAENPWNLNRRIDGDIQLSD